MLFKFHTLFFKHLLLVLVLKSLAIIMGIFVSESFHNWNSYITSVLKINPTLFYHPPDKTVAISKTRPSSSRNMCTITKAYFCLSDNFTPCSWMGVRLHLKNLWNKTNQVVHYFHEPYTTIKLLFLGLSVKFIQNVSANYNSVDTLFKIDFANMLMMDKM